MSKDQHWAQVKEQYANYVNPYLAKLMTFAGYGVEAYGEGCYLYDHEGNKFLDCLGCYGVFNLGHKHPKVMDAVKKQLELMPISGKVFFNRPQAELAAKLAEITPGSLQYTFFSNSGAEAVEAALKFAKATTQKSKLVSTHNSYHGKTLGCLTVTGREKYRTPFEPLMPGGMFVDFGDEVALKHAVDSETAAFIVEVVQGESGIRPAPKGYIQAAREACDKAGALLIVDEVQTGLGRTGKMLACEHEDIKPDIITLAKALGGGVCPIGATVMTPQIFEAVFSENTLIHSTTFGGNPLSTTAGLATLEVIAEEGLAENAAKMGEIFKENLQSVADQNKDLIKEVRGLGLMIGVEFAEDDVAEIVIAQMVKRGVVAAFTLNNKRVIRFEPPLIINQEQVLWAVEVFEEAVKESSALIELVS